MSDRNFHIGGPRTQRISSQQSGSALDCVSPKNSRAWSFRTSGPLTDANQPVDQNHPDKIDAPAKLETMQIFLSSQQQAHLPQILIEYPVGAAQSMVAPNFLNLFRSV